MEVIERLIYLYHKFHQLKVSNEEYACMKAINFLNQGEWPGQWEEGTLFLFFAREHLPLCFMPPFTLRTVTQNLTQHVGTSLGRPVLPSSSSCRAYFGYFLQT